MGVKEVETPNPFYGKDPQNPGTPTNMRWVWQFRSDAIDQATGLDYEYVHWTNTTYGDERAGLTKFLDLIMTDASFEDKANVDTDSMVGNRWKAKIGTRLNQKKEQVPDLKWAERDADNPRDEQVAIAAAARTLGGAITDDPTRDAPASIDPDEIPF